MYKPIQTQKMVLSAQVEMYRKRPFVIRHVEKGTTGFMNKSISAYTQPGADQEPDILERPRKRKKLEMPIGNHPAHDPATISGNTSQLPKRAASSPPAQPPAIFTCFDKLPTTSQRDQTFLNVNLESIIWNDAFLAEDKSQPLGKFNIKCCLSIQHNGHCGSFAAAGFPNILFRSSQTGNITITRNEDGQPLTTVNLAQIFIVPIDQLYINHRVGPTTVLREVIEDWEYGLGDDYEISISIENIGNQTSWPPCGLISGVLPHTQLGQSLSEKDSLRWVRFVGQASLFDNTAVERAIDLQVNLGEHSQSSSYVLRSRITWSSSSHNSAQLTPGEVPPQKPDQPEIHWSYMGDHTKIDGWACQICGRKLRSWQTLTAHLQGEHIQFKFDIKRPGFMDPVWKIKCSDVAIITATDSDEFFLNPAKTRYDPDDNSWVHARSSLPTPPTSISSLSSAASTPRLSEVLDLCEKPNVSRKPRKLKTIVPYSARPLLHAKTHRVLKPEEPLSPPDADIDNSWREQEHGDIIKDFLDFIPDEKDYMIAWDTHISQHRVTADVYMAEALKAFIRLNTKIGPDGHDSWFGRRRSRAKMFGLHATSMLLRAVISKATLKEGTKMIATAVQSFRGIREDAETVSPKPWVGRGITDCSCGEHVEPREAVICSGDHCAHRFHHLLCADSKSVLGGGLRPRVLRSWLCEDCR